MKNKLKKIATAFLMLFGLSMIMISCGEDSPIVPQKPKEPEDETINKDHDSPAKAEFLLAEGHLHGKYRFHQNPELKEVKYMKKIQKITFVLKKEGGWQIEQGSSKQFNVLSRQVESNGDFTKDGYAVYGMWINYYNSAGKNISSEFIDNGQDKIHQHFFVPREVKPTFDGVAEKDDNIPEKFFDYLYVDTNPWNKSMELEGAKLIGDKNPIGFKGYFTFSKPRKQFDLSVELMHAAISKYDAAGKTSPFYKPSRKQRQIDHWDLKIKIPVVVYASQNEYLEEAEPGMPKDQIPANDKKYIESVARAYGITFEEALQDIDAKLKSDSDPESGALWF